MIINCKECGKEVSNTASRCPHCGKRTAYHSASLRNLSILGLIGLGVLTGSGSLLYIALAWFLVLIIWTIYKAIKKRSLIEFTE